MNRIDHTITLLSDVDRKINYNMRLFVIIMFIYNQECMPPIWLGFYIDKFPQSDGQVHVHPNIC